MVIGLHYGGVHPQFPAADHLLDPSTSTSTITPSVTLRSFNALTLQSTGVKQINVTAIDVTRLIVCGHGRLAFRAGHEIYIVTP